MAWLYRRTWRLVGAQVTARQLAELARLSDRAKACVGWYELWANEARTNVRIGVQLNSYKTTWRTPLGRTMAHRARVALQSARKAWARVAEYAAECGL